MCSLVATFLGRQWAARASTCTDTCMSAKRVNVTVLEENILITRLVRHIDNSKFCVDKVKMMTQDRWSVPGSKLLCHYLLVESP